MGYFYGDLIADLISFVLAVCIEVVRFLLFRSFKLQFPKRPGYESYHVVYTSFCILFIFPAIVLTRIGGWLWHLVEDNTYLGGAFMVALFGLFVFLAYRALVQIQLQKEENSPENENSSSPKPSRKKLFIAASVAIVYLVLFIFPVSRVVFGGLILLLVTSALGRPIRFTDWTSMLSWLKKEEGGEEARVLFLVQAEAVVRQEPDGKVSIRTTGLPALSSQEAQKRIDTLRYLTLRLANFVQQRRTEWRRLQRADKPQDEMNRFLYLWIQHEFFPGWAAMLNELAQIVALIPEQIARERNLPEDEAVSYTHLRAHET